MSNVTAALLLALLLAAVAVAVIVWYVQRCGPGLDGAEEEDEDQ